MGCWLAGTAVVLISATIVGIHAESPTKVQPHNATTADAPLQNLRVDRPIDIRNEHEVTSVPGNDSRRLSQNGSKDNSSAPVNQTALAAMSDFTNAPKHASKEEIKSEEPETYTSLRERLFFGSLHTQTHIIVTFSTTTVPQFCLLGTATDACMVGRRKKRRSIPITLLGSEMQDEIESSLTLIGPGSEVREVKDNGKKFFTLWTKFLTTTTLTTTATNTASTISLSYYCTAGSISLPPLCG